MKPPAPSCESLDARIRQIDAELAHLRHGVPHRASRLQDASSTLRKDRGVAKTKGRLTITHADGTTESQSLTAATAAARKTLQHGDERARRVGRDLAAALLRDHEAQPQ